LLNAHQKHKRQTLFLTLRSKITDKHNSSGLQQRSKNLLKTDSELQNPVEFRFGKWIMFNSAVRGLHQWWSLETWSRSRHETSFFESLSQVSSRSQRISVSSS